MFSSKPVITDTAGLGVMEGPVGNQHSVLFRGLSVALQKEQALGWGDVGVGVCLERESSIEIRFFFFLHLNKGKGI